MQEHRQERPDDADGSDVFHAITAVVLFLLVEAAAQRAFYGPQAEFNSWGLQWALAHAAVLLGGLVVVAILAGRIGILPRLVTWTFRLGCIINPVAWGFVYWHGPLEDSGDWYLFVFVQLLAQLLMIRWVLGWHSEPAFRRRLSGLGYAAALGLSVYALPFVPMFYDSGSEGYDEDYALLDVEGIYGAQDGLMTAQIQALAPEVRGQPELFALLLGGTAYQSVFLNEVEAVGPILDSHFGSADRTLRLVNSDDTPTLYPLANRANLERALTELAGRAGPEDVVFLFLTSHGHEDLFALSFYELGTSDLTAKEFAAMLGRSGVGPAVIVLSACHSGSFLDEISAPDRLVIAAARADRTSFGCADGRDWTEFGRSFFDHALRGEPDPRKAFEIAIRDVRRKEFWSLREASLPQMREGATFGAVMDALLAARVAPVVD